MFRRFVKPSVSYVIDGLVLGMALVAGAMVGYAMLSREPPVQVLGRSLLSLTPHPLEDFSYTTSFIRTRWCETQVNRWWVDSTGAIVPEPTLPYSMRTDGLFYQQEARTDARVPYGMPSGPTEWCFRPQWVCNATQQDWMWPGPIVGPQECMTLWVNNPDVPYMPAQ